MTKTATKMTTKQMVLCALITAIICVVAPWAIPIGPVPISLTNFILYVAAYLLDWRFGTVSYLIYLLLGAVGLPVFSGYGSGLAKIVGPTGGYLVGFFAITLLCGLVNKKFPTKYYLHVIAMVVALVITYTVGTAWFVYQQKMTVMASLSLCVFPFLIGDGVKIVAAVFVGPLLRKAVSKI